MMVLNMIPADDYDRENYGVTWQSAGTVDVTGSGVHNRHHAHRVYVKGNGARVTLDAQVTVIAATPVDRPVHLGTVAIGDVIGLRFGAHVSEYVVTSRPFADPILVPVTQ